MKKAAAVSIGAFVAGALAWLGANFHLEATTPVGIGILTLIGYLISAIIHVPSPSGHTGLAKLFGTDSSTKSYPATPSR